VTDAIEDRAGIDHVADLAILLQDGAVHRRHQLEIVEPLSLRRDLSLDASKVAFGPLIGL